MAKAALSRARMRDLKKAGVASNAIATQAGGICKQTVHTRTDPDMYAAILDTMRERYRSMNQQERAAYNEQQRQQKSAAQEKSRLTATSTGPWKPEEINYLKEFGPTKTILEMAIHLGRTYYAVAHIAQRRNIQLRLN